MSESLLTRALRDRREALEKVEQLEARLALYQETFKITNIDGIISSAELARLRRIEAEARAVLESLHTGHREDIDFTAFAEALEGKP